MAQDAASYSRRGKQRISRCSLCSATQRTRSETSRFEKNIVSAALKLLPPDSFDYGHEFGKFQGFSHKIFRIRYIFRPLFKGVFVSGI